MDKIILTITCLLFLAFLGSRIVKRIKNNQWNWGSLDTVIALIVVALTAILIHNLL